MFINTKGDYNATFLRLHYMKVYEESIFGRTAYRKHTYRKLFGSNKTVCRA